MTAPMTTARLAEIEHEMAAGDGWTGDAFAQRAELLAEVKRLRALPVLRTCGECRWCHPSEVCTHPKAHAEREIDGCALPPPSWCPLRGAR